MAERLQEESARFVKEAKEISGILKVTMDSKTQLPSRSSESDKSVWFEFPSVGEKVKSRLNLKGSALTVTSVDGKQTERITLDHTLIVDGRTGMHPPSRPFHRSVSVLLFMCCAIIGQQTANS